MSTEIIEARFGDGPLLDRVEFLSVVHPRLKGRAEDVGHYVLVAQHSHGVTTYCYYQLARDGADQMVEERCCIPAVAASSSREAK